MSIIEWTTRIIKGNATGTGWITLPVELHIETSLGKWYDIKFTTNKKETFILTLKLLKQKNVWGFYIPKSLCTEHNLITQLVSLTLQPSEYFPTKISADKRIRLPKSVVECLNIKENELYEVQLNIHDKIFHEVVLITKIDRSSRTAADELYFTIRIQDIPTNTKVKVKMNKKLEQLISDKNKSSEDKVYLPNLFPDGVIGKLNHEKMILFLGNHKPVVTPILLDITDLIHYFGCYYADGTKSGYGWSISASTPEQAVYYIIKYKSIISQPNLNFQLTYTLRPSVKDDPPLIKKRLTNLWFEKAGVEISQDRVYILQSSIQHASEEIHYLSHNPIGSLRIIDNKGLTLELHVKLLRYVENFLIQTNNKNLLWQFICGVMEGDGSVGGGKKRCRIHITCKKSDKLVPKILTKLGIYQVYKEYVKGKNVLEISFGLIPILENILVIQKLLFKYYPKRRKTFIKRLLNLPSVLYILREREKLSHFALIPLKENSLLNDAILISRLKELRMELTR
ncbi:MAG: hypothetical protein HWN66_01430 [Candidatus Helarchaeota archaeon]|nr:hypothetical protein [Candidatus Helarchaeota archaeon]